MLPRYIFITGGVASSLGKGIASAALGALLQSRGFSVVLRKLDPYLNVDPGTLSPYQHGEVFVTDDGTEADLDLGHYERFTDVPATAADYVTTGKIYSTVLAKERRGEYLGSTVQVIPHITDEIKNFITYGTEETDFILCEIGGTVGDIEGLPYLEAIRQLRNDLGRDRTMFIHLTLLPYIATAGELKTKPTQHSVKELLSVGIQPDLLLCRSDRPIPIEAKRKLAQFCNVKSEFVVAALDADNIYRVPLLYHDEGFDSRVCEYFGVHNTCADLTKWNTVLGNFEKATHKIKIGIVGKYVSLPDAYKSLMQAIMHGGLPLHTTAELVWINSEIDDVFDKLKDVDGIIVPGGFGERGVEGKLSAIQYARENKVPYLGICFGMQLAVIEACRNVLGIRNASSTEFGPTADPVIGLLTEWSTSFGSQSRTEDDNLGGTMRLGAYPCSLTKGSLAQKIYGQPEIVERHRHRYEVNTTYRERLEQAGLVFSGLSPDGKLPEIVEWADHPWFVGVQFHPELKSRLFSPHPLFKSFVEACLQHNMIAVDQEGIDKKCSSCQ
ncbi:MAG: CTP synthase [Alphaproteobacteria bacterium]|nr:CTP synthase [Alphaproteobacteria bacterium]